jgi:hypothetical protein
VKDENDMVDVVFVAVACVSLWKSGPRSRRREYLDPGSESHLSSLVSMTSELWLY